jgi:hypothetical protein
MTAQMVTTLGLMAQRLPPHLSVLKEVFVQRIALVVELVGRAVQPPLVSVIPNTLVVLAETLITMPE